MQAVATLQDILLAQRGRLFGWAPVCLALGIGIYFSFRTEPGAFVWWALAVGALISVMALRFLPLAVQPLVLGLVIVAAGIGLTKWQTWAVEAPTLSFRYYGPIEGRVVNIDRSASDAVRLTLDQVRLDRVSPARTPGRVRISLHGEQPLDLFRPGDVLMTTGHLSPPAGPAEPGGFDFQRHAFFAGLGAVGYTRNPVLRAAAAKPDDLRLWIFTQRMALSRAVQNAMPGETGAFAAAIMTGDRSAMSQETLADLRASNLAHLLAISGLHMGLLTGFVFAAIRYGLAAMGSVALYWPVKKIAAVAALIVGACYLALSGGNVATERAYIMVSVMFVAVLLGRRALTLRAVAIAALIVLFLRPQALTGPGFQMSFAATTALVVVFGAMRGLNLQRLPGWAQAVISVVVSSGVAGLATAPIAAAHFNQISHYGLAANLLSVPLMGAIIMPAGLLAMLFAPLGLWQIGLWVMDLGLAWILGVAKTVAAQPGALSHVPAPDMRLLAAIVLGLLFVVLWQGRAKWAGLGVVACGFVGWSQVERPALLIADSGALTGLMTAEGRDLSKPKGAGFVAGIWLENDGAPVEQVLAAARDGFRAEGRANWAQLGAWQVLHVTGKTGLRAVEGCGGADVLVSNQVLEVARPCLTLDLATLRQTGSVAIDLEPDGALRLTTARDIAGVRPWNSATLRDGAITLTAPATPQATLAARQ